ncbi:MAG: calcium-binding protein [Aeromicrobium sp.]
MITGTPGSDEIRSGGGDDVVTGDGNAVLGGTVNGGNDTINGGDGDDYLTGDGGAALGGTVNGGDDTINGGDGNDQILGDGFDFLGGTTNGGDDVLNGGDGDDVIYGDGNDVIYVDGDSGVICIVFFCSPTANGGDDVLNGEGGNDVLLGNSGSDLLCGGEGDDLLLGGEDADIACAVDDVVTVAAGVVSVLDLAGNDEQLDDETSEVSPLIYSIEKTNRCTDATIDADTGELTFSATRSGSLTYGVTRADAAFTTLADVLIAVTGRGRCGAVTGSGSTGNASTAADNVVTTAGYTSAVLPDAGAPEHVMLGAAGGLLLVLSGLGLIAGERRRIRA